MQPNNTLGITIQCIYSHQHHSYRKQQ